MPRKTSAPCKQAFKSGTIRTGKSGGLYVMKRSSVTNKMYKLYCTDAFKKSGSKKMKPRSLF